MKEAKITLHGTISDPEIPIYGAKVFLIIIMLHHFFTIHTNASAVIEVRVGHRLGGPAVGGGVLNNSGKRASSHMYKSDI